MDWDHYLQNKQKWSKLHLLSKNLRAEWVGIAVSICTCWGRSSKNENAKNIRTSRIRIWVSIPKRAVFQRRHSSSCLRGEVYGMCLIITISLRDNYSSHLFAISSARISFPGAGVGGSLLPMWLANPTEQTLKEVLDSFGSHFSTLGRKYKSDSIWGGGQKEIVFP